MKITQKKLAQIIKEEVGALLKERPVDVFAPPPKSSAEHKGACARACSYVPLTKQRACFEKCMAAKTTEEKTKVDAMETTKAMTNSAINRDIAVCRREWKTRTQAHKKHPESWPNPGPFETFVQTCRAKLARARPSCYPNCDMKAEDEPSYGVFTSKYGDLGRQVAECKAGCTNSYSVGSQEWQRCHGSCEGPLYQE